MKTMTTMTTMTTTNSTKYKNMNSTKYTKLPFPFIFSIMISAMVLLGACGDFLDGKSDKRLAIPESVSDFQALLESPTILLSEPMYGEVSSDDYYLRANDWAALGSEFERRAYTWEPDYLYGEGINDWTIFSNAVYVANTVIEGLEKMEDKTHPEYSHLLAQARFLRGRRVLQASFIWCAAYDPATAGAMLGLPLRAGVDFNETSVRASLEQTYQQIIADLSASVTHLPVRPLNVIRPSRPAAYGTLARAYLYMGDYAKAYAYADSCLQISSTLLDFNTINAAAARPMPPANVEVLYECGFAASQILGITRMRVDSTLYAMYDPNDLRKSVFFQPNPEGSHSFKGTMMQVGNSYFSGISTSEMYLVRAESAYRMGNVTRAQDDINQIRKARYRNGSFVPIVLSAQADPMAFILAERRKELAFRSLRWTDIKRLNSDGYQMGITRRIDQQRYDLPANDLRFSLPIPEDVIEMSGMQQNPR